jgi:hypothetical protein
MGAADLQEEVCAVAVPQAIASQLVEGRVIP